MSEDWKEVLRRRYHPWLSGPRYGVECGDGWEGLVTEMLERIAEAVGSPAECPDLRLVLFRQSYGWLMCHAHGVSNDRKIAVCRAFQCTTSRSTRTCELCGQPGTQREEYIDRDLWTVMCDGCREGGRNDEELE